MVSDCIYLLAAEPEPFFNVVGCCLPQAAENGLGWMAQASPLPWLRGQSLSRVIYVMWPSPARADPLLHSFPSRALAMDGSGLQEASQQFCSDSEVSALSIFSFVSDKWEAI